MTDAFAQLQRLGQLLLRAQGFRARADTAADGRRFFVHERAGTGAGPPAVLVHGLGGSATSFTSIARAMCRLCRRVLVLDLPGHGLAALGAGETPADALELAIALGRVLETLSEPALLVGNSLGGGLVLGAAVLWPERVRGVVGLAPAGAPFSEAEAAEVRAVFRGGAPSGAELGRRLFAAPPWGLRLFSRGLGEHIGKEEVQHIVGRILAGEQGLPLEDLRGLRVPALVLWGEGEAVLPRSGLDYFRRALPPGSVELVPRCGHLPQIEQPRLVLARLEKFIANIPAKATSA